MPLRMVPLIDKDLRYFFSELITIWFNFRFIHDFKDVYENQPVGSVIFNAIKAYDLDGPLFNEFLFSLGKINPLSDSGLFEIQETEQISNGRFKSSIKLNRNLDYESSRYHVITLLAKGLNSPFISSTELTVNVLDYPDRPPEFSQSPYYVKIEEEMDLVIYDCTHI